MHIDHVHFYVEDARTWRDWFIQTMGFEAIATSSTSHTRTDVIRHGAIWFALSSPLTTHSPIATYLDHHPAGIGDLAFRVTNIELVLQRAIAQGATLLQPLQIAQRTDGYLQWARIQGWGDLTHTLIECHGILFALPTLVAIPEDEILSAALSHRWQESSSPFTGIDHAVLNVAKGDLDSTVHWYETCLGFQQQQTFSIQTDYSALYSQVLLHPDGTAQLPINEPASATSQIQEFLDVNRGSGIQHIALHLVNLVDAIAPFRQQGLTFLQVPPTYYDQLRHRPGFGLTETEWQAIAQQGVLVDWQEQNPNALLFQIFTHPIFDKPTFFLELIERHTYVVNHQPQQATGFGEGNFRALFEAIEREQQKRGTLDYLFEKM